MRMSKPEKKALVPALRFPEFRDAALWENKVFEEAFRRLTTKNSENNQNALTISAQQGLVSQLEYFNKKIAAKDLSGYYLLRKGDFAYNKSYSQGYPMGAIKPLKFYDKGVVSTLYICFRAKKEFNESFFEHYFETGLLNSEIGKIAQEGGRAHGLLNVSVKEFFKNVKLLIPEIDEQQKIADCLSSIDDLITAQTQKLAALKAHKKGLMQQLFPAEGETVPKLRFPEFRDGGEWEEKTLEQVARYENGKAHEQDIDEEGEYIVVNSKFISTEGEVKKFSHSANLLAEKDDILMVLSDIPNGRAIAKCFYVDKDDTYTVNQRICKLTAKDTVSTMLFYILDRNAYFLDFDDGVKQTNLKKDDVLNCPILLPKDKTEQQKIVDCLSSVDELITAQSQKIEALKSHKKGLMQQLFPSMDEVDG